MLEIDAPADVFCGFVHDAQAQRGFARASAWLLHYQRLPFCYEDGVTTHVPGYSQCCKPRKPGDAFFPCIHGFDDPAKLPSCSG